MTSSTETTGKTVEAAIAAAEEELRTPRNQLEIQILSHGSRGVFGLGGEPARVRAKRTVVEEAPPAPIQEEPSTPLPEEAREEALTASRLEMEAPNGKLETASRSEPAEARTHVDPSVVAAGAQEILTEMLRLMGFDAEVEVRSEDPMTLDVSGENLGVLIGRRGESLSALQFMLNVILSKRFHKWPRVAVDVQGYRTRREQSLHSLGVRVAERVKRNRRPFTLEAMPANDRRIIHIALRDRSDIETYSIGEGSARRVVIAPRR